MAPTIRKRRTEDRVRRTRGQTANFATVSVDLIRARKLSDTRGTPSDAPLWMIYSDGKLPKSSVGAD